MSIIQYSIQLFSSTGEPIKHIIPDNCTEHETALVNLYKDYNIASEITFINVELRLSDVQPEENKQYEVDIEEAFGELTKEINYDSSGSEAVSPA